MLELLNVDSLLHSIVFAPDQVIHLVDAIAEKYHEGKAAEDGAAHRPILVALVRQLQHERGLVDINDESALLATLLRWSFLHFLFLYQ